MSLASLLVVREAVPAPDGAGSISFRGLSYFDIVTLFSSHADDFRAAIPLIRAQAAEGEVNLAGIASQLAQASPLLLAHALALAADAPADVEAFLQAPGVFQLEAAMTVARLTFRDPSALPKLLASLTKGLTQMTALAQSIPTR